MISARRHRHQSRRRPPDFKPDLDSFLWPVTRSEFFEKYWQKKPLVLHGPASRLKRLLSHFHLKTDSSAQLEELEALARHGHTTEALTGRPTPDGKFHIFTTPWESALDLYRCGFLVYFNLKDKTSEAWRSQFAAELGINTNRGETSILAGRRSASADLHFDKNEDFTIQLRGNNRWWYAPERAVFRPRDNWIPSMYPLPDTVRRHSERPPQPPSLKSMKQFDLRAGSILYMPRGYWHATERQEDSLAFHFAYGSYDWVDVLLQALQNALIASTEWRSAPDGAFGDAKGRLAARQHLHRMLQGLSSSLPLLAEDLFQEPPSRPLRRNGRYRKNMLAGFYAEKGLGNGTENVSFDYLGIRPKRVTLPLPGPAIEVCRWIGARPQSFEIEDLRVAFPKATLGQLRELLGLLIKARFINYSN